MKFDFQPYRFELLYRPLYEFHIAFVWCGCAILTYIVGLSVFSFPAGVLSMQAMICIGMAGIFFLKGFGLWRIQKQLYGSRLEFVELGKFIDRTRPYIRDDAFWLGEGFLWTPEQSQRAYEMFKLRWSELAEYESLPSRLSRRYKRAMKAVAETAVKIAGRAEKPGKWRRKAELTASFASSFVKPLKPEPVMGQRWIHGLSTKHEQIAIPANWFNGHLLILGTTGSGKTRLADLLNTQCIMRGESLVIIDPKGDTEMRDNAKKACDAYRKYCLDKGLPDPGNRFYFFHPAFPEESVRLNLLANSARDTDISTRITNLIQSDGFDPFTAFGWMSINAIVQALLYIGENPTINSIKMHLLDSMEKLTDKAVDEFCHRADQLEKEAKGALSHKPYDTLVRSACRRMKAQTPEKVCTEKCNIFNEYYSGAQDATNIAALVKLRNHPREHFSKMINNMLPLLDMLTVGTLGTMLSMSPGDDPMMQHNTINTLDILDRKGVLYIGLDSLSDKMVGTAIGSLALSDIAASAGTLYNYRKERPPVNVFVDEASECVNDSFIQILNKGRGAGMRLMVATQTISDFVAALGSDAKEEMVLGNVNNVIALRTQNETSQEYLCNKLPNTVIRTITHTQGINSLTTQPFLHGASQSEQLKETEAPLIQQQLFGLLPNLEYIGIFAGGRIIKGKLPIITGGKKAGNRAVKPVNDERDYGIGFDIDTQAEQPSQEKTGNE